MNLIGSLGVNDDANNLVYTKARYTSMRRGCWLRLDATNYERLNPSQLRPDANTNYLDARVYEFQSSIWMQNLYMDVKFIYGCESFLNECESCMEAITINMDAKVTQMYYLL